MRLALWFVLRKQRMGTLNFRKPLPQIILRNRQLASCVLFSTHPNQFSKKKHQNICPVPVRAWHDKCFSGRWNGRGGKTDWLLAKSLSYSAWFLSVHLGQTENEPIKVKTTDTSEQKIRYIFATVPHDFFRNDTDSVSSRFQKSVQNTGACVAIWSWMMVCGL